MEEIRLSEYGSASVEPSPVNTMTAAFASDFRDGIDINLGVGYVNEKTIPRKLIEKSLHNVLADNKKFRGSLNYGGPKGTANLINSIKNFLIQNSVSGLTAPVIDKNEIIIAPSGATSLLDGIAHILPKGVVITTDPIYYIYSNSLERIGFKILAVPEDRDGINIDLLTQAVERLGEEKKNISFVYVVTINNPTCTILSNERQRHLVEFVSRLSNSLGRKVPLFLDKAYEDLIHDESIPKRESALLYDKEGIAFELYTLSKIIAPALRIGYMAGPACEFTTAMIQRTSDMCFSAPVICQEMASFILDNYAAEQIKNVRQGYHQKALQTKKYLDEYLGEFLSEYTGGQAGFYYYLTFKQIETGENSKFFKFLTRTTGRPDIDGPTDNKNTRVIYIPGQFCVHSKGSLTELGKRQLRLSYGFEELDNIRKAVQLMKEAAIFSLH